MSRVLVLCYEYPPLGGGGGRVAAQVAAALAERGHEVRFVTAGMAYLPKHTIDNGVEVIRVRARRHREDTCTVFEMLFWILAAFPIALRLAWVWRPQVIHAHFAVPTGAVAWMVHQLTQIPYVLTVHLGDVPGGVPEQTDWLFKIVKPFTIPIWRAAAKVTAVSSFVADLARKAYCIDPIIIFNGTSLPPGPPERLGSKVPQLLMVGRLSIQKNPLLAIQALALLKEIPWTLQIIGEGPLFSSIEAEVIAAGLQDRVVFSGWLSADGVKEAMLQADILLMPSLSEGLPMAGIEALAHGLAIVGSRIGGLQDIISEGTNGSYFDLAEGALGMAKALAPFLKDQKLLQQNQKASLMKAKLFKWDQSIDAYQQILAAVTP